MCVSSVGSTGEVETSLCSLMNHGQEEGAQGQTGPPGISPGYCSGCTGDWDLLGPQEIITRLGLL